MPDTIWSHSGKSTSNSPTHSTSSLHFMTVLDQVDPEVTKLFGERRFSLNDGSDIDNTFLGLKKGSLSAITAPVGAPKPSNHLGLGTASISGGIPSRHPPQDSFLQKFSAVAEATREMELQNGFSKLGLESSSRRTSFNNDIKPKFGLSPHGSLNENLNDMRTSRHQSISEKIDHYNSTSPIQATASLSDTGEVPKNPPSFWNPATAAPFTPGMYSGFSGPMGPGPMGPIGPGVVPPPVPPAEFNPYRGGSPFVAPLPQFIDPEYYEDDKKARKMGATGGVGLNNQQYAPPASFMYPFAYQMYGPPPFVDTPYSAPTETEASSTPTPPPPPPSAPKRKNKPKEPRGSHIYRSPLLEEVRANKNKEFHLKDIYGHAVEFTKDQYGSRFIQQKLGTSTPEEKEVIFNEIRDIAYELMTDVFGNYVIQKYFEHGSPTHKQVLLEAMYGHIQSLSLQMYGCRVIQRALEEIGTEAQIRVASELRDHVLVCSKDQNGNHVIQKSIECIPFVHVRFILDALKDEVYHLSTHPYGCRVIQRLLEFSDKRDQENILAELNRFIFYLIQDQYGNYVMQHILERGDAENREAILRVVLGSVVTFSKHKFASNVIEKCIKYGTDDQRKRILDEVMLGNEDLGVETVADESPLALMMKDQFANYVIQKLVEGFDSRSTEKRTLVVKLRQYLKQMSAKNSYGKHLASVEKMIVVAETALANTNEPTRTK